MSLCEPVVFRFAQPFPERLERSASGVEGVSGSSDAAAQHRIFLVAVRSMRHFAASWFVSRSERIAL